MRTLEARDDDLSMFSLPREMIAASVLIDGDDEYFYERRPVAADCLMA